VRLFAELKDDEQVDTVVQPDLSAICDSNKLDEKGCKGSPDLVIEILSPSSAKMDKMIKLGLYEKAKMKEYWVVDPHHELIEIYYLKGGKYESPKLYSKDDQLRSILYEDLVIELQAVFNE
jgi:Uma2 family endonuclease